MRKQATKQLKLALKIEVQAKFVPPEVAQRIVGILGEQVYEYWCRRKETNNRMEE